VKYATINFWFAVIFCALNFAAMKLLKFTPEETIQIILWLILFNVVRGGEDLRDMWKGRKP